MTTCDGEMVLPENINYVDCKHGDVRGIIRCEVNGKSIVIPWDGVTESELDALFKAVEFYNQNKV